MKSTLISIPAHESATNHSQDRAVVNLTTVLLYFCRLFNCHVQEWKPNILNLSLDSSKFFEICILFYISKTQIRLHKDLSVIVQPRHNLEKRGCSHLFMPVCAMYIDMTT